MSEANRLQKIGAKPQKNSGRGHYQKGDGIIDGIITVDVKEASRSFTLNQGVWSKLCMDNYRNKTMYPALNIVLNNETGLMIIEQEFFEELFQAWKTVHLNT